MFAGIVDQCGTIVKLFGNNLGFHCWVATSFHDLQPGESIAVDGVCVTVEESQGNQFRCSISPETLAITTLGELTVNAQVNLERALRLSDRLGGHFVTGHVDCIAHIVKRKAIAECLELHVQVEDVRLPSWVVSKGSVAINGVSLTVNAVAEASFSVMLIPHTLQRTNLATLQPGHKVNLEYDYLAKLVAAQIQAWKTQAPC